MRGAVLYLLFAINLFVFCRGRIKGIKGGEGIEPYCCNSDSCITNVEGKRRLACVRAFAAALRRKQGVRGGLCIGGSAGVAGERDGNAEGKRSRNFRPCSQTVFSFLSPLSPAVEPYLVSEVKPRMQGGTVAFPTAVCFAERPFGPPFGGNVARTLGATASWGPFSTMRSSQNGTFITRITSSNTCSNGCAASITRNRG